MMVSLNKKVEIKPVNLKREEKQHKNYIFLKDSKAMAGFPTL